MAIVLLVGLVGAIADYTSITSGKDNTISSKDSQISEFQTWLSGNETLLSQTQTWLEGNITYYNSQISSLNSQITNLQNQKSQLETWLNGNETSYEAQISLLNAQIGQLQTWLSGNETYYQNQIAALKSTISSQSAQIANLQSVFTNSLNVISLLNGVADLSDNTTWVNNQTVNEPAGGSGVSYYYWYYPASYAGYVSIDVISANASTWATVAYSYHGVNYNVALNVGAGGTALFPVLPSLNITLGVGNGNTVGGATQTVTITYCY
jgi:flagellar biosynthesis chaperone FliJ